MRVPRKVGRFRAVIAAVVLAIGALAIPSSAVPVSTRPAANNPQPAVAQQGCAHTPNAVPTWNQTFNQGGVTLCQGDGADGDDEAYMQIIDLNAGAKVRLISNSCLECDPDADARDLQFNKRTAPEWFDWLKDPANFRTPGPSRLFSTSNASFFIDTSPGTSASPLSFPEHSLVEKFPGGNSRTELSYGYVLKHNEDLGWNHPKLAITFGDADSPKQKVGTIGFPMHYTVNDILELQTGAPPGECCVDWERVYGDSTVGRPPLFDPTGTGENDRRTYVGVDGALGNVDTVYILNTRADFNVGEARTLIESFGAAFEVQLDGGGSTQLALDADRDGTPGTVIDSDDPRGDRPVPDTLAVYLAP